MIDHLRATPTDVVFPAVHGAVGENGCLQGLLDVLGLAYVRSVVLASACANDKPTAKALFRGAGLPVARQVVVQPAASRAADVEHIFADLGGDVVVNPTREGSAIGLGFPASSAELLEYLAVASRKEQPLLVEWRIHGPEITVGVLDLDDNPHALPVVGIETPQAPGTTTSTATPLACLGT